MKGDIHNTEQVTVRPSARTSPIPAAEGVPKTEALDNVYLVSRPVRSHNTKG